MTDAYVIEVAGRTAGIVARAHARETFTFFASDRGFHALEGRQFAAPWAATRAARQLIEQGHKSRTKAARVSRAQEMTA